MLNIKQRQMNLKYLGYYTKQIDGIEGAGTKQAYRNFQSANALIADGIYGRKTDAKLIQIIKEEQRRLGVVTDGVAGEITTKARDNQYNWNNVKHFKKEEFTCKCGCGLNNIELKLVKILDQIRENFGQATIVNSGTRCTKHNQKVGGVANSRHLSGKACDIVVRGVKGSTLLSYTKQLQSNGLLRYTYLISGDAVHVDIV